MTRLPSIALCLGLLLAPISSIAAETGADKRHFLGRAAIKPGNCDHDNEEKYKEGYDHSDYSIFGN